VFRETYREIKLFVALVTIVSSFSGVAVHVASFVRLKSEHFRTEITFELRWRMDFAVNNDTS